MNWAKKLLCAAAILFSIFHLDYSYGFTAPDPSKTFYGDATGDQQVNADDIAIHKSLIFGGNPVYNTPQPNTPSQRWNTCDITAASGIV